MNLRAHGYQVYILASGLENVLEDVPEGVLASDFKKAVANLLDSNLFR